MYDAICLGFKQYIWEAFLSLFFLTLLCILSIVKYCLSYLHNAFQTHLLMSPSNPVVHNQVWFSPQRTFGNDWRPTWLSQCWVRDCCPLVGKGPEMPLNILKCIGYLELSGPKHH